MNVPWRAISRVAWAVRARYREPSSGFLSRPTITSIQSLCRPTSTHLTSSLPFVPLSQHLMKRIQRGPVRGISLKLQEEERERRMDFVPDESALAVETIEVDRDTMDMLKSLNMANLPGVTLQQGRGRGGFQGKREGGGNRN